MKNVNRLEKHYLWHIRRLTRKKTYRVSVKYKSGPLAGKFVVQAINVSYKIACELYDIWTLEGYEVLIIQMNCRKPNLQKKWLYKPKKNRRRQNEL